AIGFFAALAADLDRPRPRPGLIASIAAMYAGLGFAYAAVLANGPRVESTPGGPALLPLATLAVPFLAGCTRARWSGDPVPLVRAVICLALTIAAPLIALGLVAFSPVLQAIRYGFLQDLSGLTALAGLAVTAGLIGAGIDTTPGTPPSAA